MVFTARTGSATAKTYLITGATGQQGGAVANALLDRGHKVRALTRTPAKAEKLRQRGAEIIEGDFTHANTVEQAARGVQGAFIMSTPFEKGPDAETAQGIAAIDAAVKAKVAHVVYTSVSDANRDTGIPHFDSKRRVEEHLEGFGVPYTIVAPVFFRENLLSPWMRPGIQQGHLDMGLPGDRELQSVELREIGRFGAKVLEHAGDFEGQRINIASDSCTPLDMARAIEAASGQPIRYNQVPLDVVRKQSADSARMFEWFDETGYSADIEGLRAEHPDIKWRSFKDWAADAWANQPPVANSPPAAR